jgi:hypothetical protein
VHKIVDEAKKSGQPIERIQEKTLFEPLFSRYRDVVTLNKRVEEMHARNISIIWKYIP